MGKTSFNVQKELESLIKESDIKDKLVILKVKGEMVSGKTADINFLMLEKLLAEMGAVYPMISRSQAQLNRIFFYKSNRIQYI